MKSPTPQPKKYAVDCPPACTFHPDRIGADVAKQLLGVREKGFGVVLFGKEAERLLGRVVPSSSITRHLRHYRELVGPLAEPTDDDGNTRRASDVEILDAVIQSAWRNRASWRPSLRDMLEAMAKKHSITGGSEASDLMRLFDDAALEDEEPSEAPEAVLSPDERPTEDSDDLADA